MVWNNSIFWLCSSTRAAQENNYSLAEKIMQWQSVQNSWKHIHMQQEELLGVSSVESSYLQNLLLTLCNTAQAYQNLRHITPTNFTRQWECL